jgi:SpoVK/Ycf46/Vps4 family AAA+-type ATPase
MGVQTVLERDCNLPVFYPYGFSCHRNDEDGTAGLEVDFGVDFDDVGEDALEAEHNVLADAAVVAVGRMVVPNLHQSDDVVEDVVAQDLARMEVVQQGTQIEDALEEAFVKASLEAFDEAFEEELVLVQVLGLELDLDLHEILACENHLEQVTNQQKEQQQQQP